MLLYKKITLLGLTVLVLACQPSGQQQDASAHMHGDITVPYTAYSDKIEVFADVQPFAVNQNSQLIVHFTSLETFKPLNSDSVTAQLIVGNNGLEVVQKAPSQSGIYRFTFRPVAAGTGQLVFKLHANGMEQVVSITNIKVYDDAHDAIHFGEELIPGSPNAIAFTKEKSWKVDFATAFPEEKLFGAIIKATGQVQASPLSQAIISAKTSGFVHLTSGILSEGKKVNAGDHLMTITGSGITENNALVMLQQAKAEYDMAKSEYDRNKQLSEQQIVSDKKLQESKSRYEQARSQWTNLKKTVDQSGEKVLSTQSGFIHQLLVTEGQYVEAGDALFSLVKNDRLVLKAMVRQSHMGDLAALYDANVVLSDEKIVSLKDLNGQILSVAQSATPNNHLIPVTIEVDYQQSLSSSGFATLYLKTSSENPVIVIPESALIEEQGLFFVFVQLTPELFVKRQIQTGASDGLSREVVSGLDKTERIVTRGAILVKLAAVSNTIDPHAGHVH